MRRHIALTVIRNFSNLHLKNEKACNCDNLRKFLLPFISHLIKKTGQETALDMPVIPFPSEGCNLYLQAMRMYHVIAPCNLHADRTNSATNRRAPMEYLVTCIAPIV